MKKNTVFLLLIFLGVLIGCDAAITMRGKVMSVSSGQFIYQDGNLITNYKADIDLVWSACEKTVTQLKGTDVKKERKISTGTIKAVIQDEKVNIYVEYITKNSTSVSIFVGVAGNNMASRLIHEKITGNLINP
ncbi:MAG: hypothetical protein CVU54_08230 [Deltaproteobacteria bacterium HGW-Deltaproteobacteria-12]|jgi:hypothetical protein|nr:MAG: hypothetical protein CVU54_08230 [Deltaproteobacteria bacterium HGW-Deltaproteobacteria-12]